jgi:hypothetical protein
MKLGKHQGQLTLLGEGGSAKVRKPKTYFKTRLDKAVRFILSERPHGRQLDEAFEMFDGDQMTAAIIRRARKNPRLDEIIWKRYSSPRCDWYKITALRDGLTDQQLEDEADQMRLINRKLSNLLWEPENVFLYGAGIHHSPEGHLFVDAIHDFKNCSICNGGI